MGGPACVGAAAAREGMAMRDEGASRAISGIDMPSGSVMAASNASELGRDGRAFDERSRSNSLASALS